MQRPRCQLEPGVQAWPDRCDDALGAVGRKQRELPLLAVEPEGAHHGWVHLSDAVVPEACDADDQWPVCHGILTLLMPWHRALFENVQVEFDRKDWPLHCNISAKGRMW